MRVAGRYGDTHVPPAELFDLNDPTAAPPRGSIDAQFRCPVSLSAMLDGMAHGGLQKQVEAWSAAYADLVGRQLRQIQELCGYALQDAEIAVPARLSMTAVVEPAVAGVEHARWHAHVYIGPTAEVLADGVHRPVAGEAIARKLQQGAYAAYMRELEPLAERMLGVTWGRPRPGAEFEIVDPPWHEHLGTGDRGICDGPWGRRGELVLADESVLRLASSAEQRIRGESGLPELASQPDWEDARAARTAWIAQMTASSSRA